MQDRLYDSVGIVYTRITPGAIEQPVPSLYDRARSATDDDVAGP